MSGLSIKSLIHHEIYILGVTNRYQPSSHHMLKSFHHFAQENLSWPDRPDLSVSTRTRALFVSHTGRLGQVRWSRTMLCWASLKASPMCRRSSGPMPLHARWPRHVAFPGGASEGICGWLEWRRDAMGGHRGERRAFASKYKQVAFTMIVGGRGAFFFVGRHFLKEAKQWRSLQRFFHMFFVCEKGDPESHTVSKVNETSVGWGLLG